MDLSKQFRDASAERERYFSPESKRFCFYNIDDKIIFIRNNKKYNYYRSKIYLFCIKIEYDNNNKPINMKLLSKEKYIRIKEIEYEIEDIECIDENKILFTCNKNFAQVFKKNKENQFFLYKSFDIKIKNTFRKSNNLCLYDKFNKQIIIYYNIDRRNNYINIYDAVDYKIKKIINIETKSNDVNIEVLNKEYYIHISGGRLSFISSKYLEIISVFKIDFGASLFRVLNNANLIILKNYYHQKKKLTIYKFHKNEIKYIRDIPINYNNIKDIKEINDKGVHIIIYFNEIQFNCLGYKTLSRISYIKNRNIENIKDDYSKLHKDISKYHFNNNRYRLDTDYFWPDFDENIWDENLAEWENYCEKFNRIKEDRNIMKKNIKIKEKVNILILDF